MHGRARTDIVTRTCERTSDFVYMISDEYASHPTNRGAFRTTAFTEEVRTHFVQIPTRWIVARAKRHHVFTCVISVFFIWMMFHQRIHAIKLYVCNDVRKMIRVMVWRDFVWLTEHKFWNGLNIDRRRRIWKMNAFAISSRLANQIIFYAIPWNTDKWTTPARQDQCSMSIPMYKWSPTTSYPGGHKLVEAFFEVETFFGTALLSFFETACLLPLNTS